MKNNFALVILFMALSVTSFGQGMVGDTIQFEDMSYDPGSVWDVPSGFNDFVGLSLNDLGVFASETINFGQAGTYVIEVRGFVNYNPDNQLILEIDGVGFDTISFPESSVNWWSDPMTYDDISPATVAFKPIQIDNELLKVCKFILGEGNGDLILDWALVKEAEVENMLSWLETPPSEVKGGAEVKLKVNYTASDNSVLKAAMNVYSTDGTYLRPTMVETFQMQVSSTTLEGIDEEISLTVPEQLELSSSLADGEEYRWDVSLTDVSSNEQWLAGINSKVVVAGETGIHNSISFGTFKLYPNPSTDGVIKIVSDDLSTEVLSVHDALGRRISYQTTKSNGSTQIIINDEGLFIISFQANGIKYSNKIVVRKR